MHTHNYKIMYLRTCTHKCTNTPPPHTHPPTHTHTTHTQALVLQAHTKFMQLCVCAHKCCVPFAAAVAQVSVNC